MTRPQGWRPGLDRLPACLSQLTGAPTEGDRGARSGPDGAHHPDPEPSLLGHVQGPPGSLPEPEEACPLGRTSSLVAVLVDESDLRRHEQDNIAPRNVRLPPGGRGPVRHESDSVAVLEELFKPWHEAIAASERRIHPHEAFPAPGQTIMREEGIRRDP